MQVIFSQLFCGSKKKLRQEDLLSVFGLVKEAFICHLTVFADEALNSCTEFVIVHLADCRSSIFFRNFTSLPTILLLKALGLRLYQAVNDVSRRLSSKVVTRYLIEQCRFKCLPKRIGVGVKGEWESQFKQRERFY